MASFGTTQKCRACDKTVHFAEMMSADGIPFHKTCFKCINCSGRLSMSNYSAVDGQLYCKLHYEQLCRENGGCAKPSQTSKPEQNKTPPSRMSSFFSGTQEKCSSCKKTVYPLEKISVEGENYHKQCFKCAHGGCLITPSSYAALDGTVYCKIHFAQLFKEKGSYSNMKNKKKTPGDATPEAEPEHEAEAEAEPEAEPEKPADSPKEDAED